MESLSGRALARAELVHAGESALDLTACSIRSRRPPSKTCRPSRPSTSRLMRHVRCCWSPIARGPSSGDGNGDTHPRPGASVPGVQADAEPGARARRGRSAPRLRRRRPSPRRRARAPPACRRWSNGLTVIALRRPGLAVRRHAPGVSRRPAAGRGAGRAPRDRYVPALGAIHRTARARPAAQHRSRRRPACYESLAPAGRQRRQGAGHAVRRSRFACTVFWPNPQFDRWADAAARIEATAEARAARAFRMAWTTGTTTSHVYARAGSYAPAVTLTDHAGNHATVTTAAVTVRADTSRPTAGLSRPGARTSVAAWRVLKGRVGDSGSGPSGCMCGSSRSAVRPGTPTGPPRTRGSRAAPVPARSTRVVRDAPSSSARAGGPWDSLACARERWWCA